MRFFVMIGILACLSVAIPAKSNGASGKKGEKMTALEMGFFAIPVLDIAAAKKFYGPVMGWDFNDRDPNFHIFWRTEI